MTTNPTNPNTASEPLAKDADEPAESTKTQKYQGGGLTPNDSRNVTGTAVTEDGRWTGAAVKPDEGPSVPEPKD